MRPHPYAELFPPVDDISLRRLADDIEQNGQQEPIWTLDGRILDGRNRWRACEMVGVVPRTVEYTGDDPLSFVISLNLRRRQLSPSQLAIIGLEIEAHRAKEIERKKASKCRVLACHRSRDELGRLVPADQVTQKVGELGLESGERSEKPTRGAASSSTSLKSTSRYSESARQAARDIGVNHDYISKAKRIAQEAPDLLELVKSGALKLRAATLLARLPQEQRAQIVAQPHNLRKVRQLIAAANPNAPETSDRVHTQTPVAQLSHLRECFMEVLSGYRGSSRSALQPLADCVKGFLLEIEKRLEP